MSDCNFTEFINSSECVGDSLIKINNNFTTLDNVVCSLLGASPSVANLRMSLDPSAPIPTTNRSGTNASVLYIHPYKGSSVSLYNLITRRWGLNEITNVLAFPLTTLVADRNFDIFLYRELDSTYKVEFIAWPDSSAGALPPTKIYRNGIAVKSLSESNKRYIGCLRTAATGQSEQTIGAHQNGGYHAKQYLWNAQNQEPVSVYGFDTGTYYATGTGNGWTNWRRVHLAVNGGRNHRFSFICGEPMTLEMVGQIYCSYYANLTQTVSYCAFGFNDENNPSTSQGYQMISELRGSDMTPRAHVWRTYQGGYNFLQLIENILVGVNVTATMNEGHTNQTGYIGSLIN